VSKLQVEVEVNERRRALDLGSVRGKRICWRESRVSRARGRGRTPLVKDGC
jgi:hypothetical protein